MAWGGTQSIEIAKNAFFIESLGYDADAEEGTVIDCINHLGFIPTEFSAVCVESAAGKGFDIALQGSIDGITYEDIITCVANNVMIHASKDYTSATDEVKLYRYLKVLCADVNASDAVANDLSFSCLCAGVGGGLP